MIPSDFPEDPQLQFDLVLFQAEPLEVQARTIIGASHQLMQYLHDHESWRDQGYESWAAFVVDLRDKAPNQYARDFITVIAEAVT